MRVQESQGNAVAGEGESRRDKKALLVGQGTNASPSCDGFVGSKVAGGGIACDEDKRVVLTSQAGGANVPDQQIVGTRRFVMQDTRHGFALTSQRTGEGDFGLFRQRVTRRNQGRWAAGIPDLGSP